MPPPPDRIHELLADLERFVHEAPQLPVQATDAVVRAERITDLREHYRAAVAASTRGIANQVVVGGPRGQLRWHAQEVLSILAGDT